MRCFKYLTVLFLIINNSLLFSQKITKPDKISVKDFDMSNFTNTTILLNNILVTFPYKMNRGSAGALDSLFSLRIENLTRVCVTTDEPDKSLFILPEIYGKEPKLNSIAIYYQKGNSIVTEKVNPKTLAISHDSIGYHIDLSKVVKSTYTIVDLYYSSYHPTKKAKEKIIFYLDNDLIYKDFNIQILIPEIYTYFDFLNEPGMNTEIKRNCQGPKIGYWGSADRSDVICQAIMETFSEMFGGSYQAAYCSQYLLSFKLKEAYNGINADSYKKVLDLRLLNINEIK